MSILSPNKNPKKQLDFINKVVDKKELNRLLSRVFAENGTAKTGQLANSLKDLGFKYATLAGVTISIQDLIVDNEKKALLQRAEEARQRDIEGVALARERNLEFDLARLLVVAAGTGAADVAPVVGDHPLREARQLFDRLGVISTA